MISHSENVAAGWYKSTGGKMLCNKFQADYMVVLLGPVL